MNEDRGILMDVHNERDGIIRGNTNNLEEFINSIEDIT